MAPSIDLSELSRAELEALVVRLLGEVPDLQRQVAELREEVARLKGVSPRPQLKPSGMERATAPQGARDCKRRGAASRCRK